jgi:uncharacterized membrane protein YbhN (UPF0104 family)
MPQKSASVTSTSDRRNKWWVILKIFLGLVLFAFVLSKIRSQDVAALAQRISLPWLPVCLFIYIASVWCIAKRYHEIIGQDISFDKIFGIVVIQSVIGSMLANIAGITYYVAMLRGKYQVGLGNGIWSLVAARFFDILVWLPFFGVASWLLWSQLAPLHIVIILALVFMSAIVMGIALALTLRQRFLAMLKKILTKLSLDRFPLIQKIIGALESLVQGSLLKNFRSLILYSLLILINSCALFYCTLKLFGISLDKAPVILMVIITQVLMLLPIHVFGGLGWLDVSHLYLYGLFGFGEHLIAPVIVGGRVVFYAMTLILLLYFPGRNFYLWRQK